MRTMILAAFALALVSCAHSKGDVKPDSAASGEHSCGPDCTSCGGHGEKHGADHAKKDGSGVGHTAENMKEHVDGLFAKLDGDSDKALTLEEVGEHHLSGKFAQADADADGKISYDEMIAFGTKMHAKMAAKEEAPVVVDEASSVEEAASSVEDAATPEAP